jgi:lysophospholipase L1-like esterase
MQTSEISQRNNMTITALRAARLISLWLIVCVATLAVAHGQDGGVTPRRIAMFGSSVANGTGDELAKEGFTGRLRELLAPRGWEVLNQSRGGDNTLTMAPRFAPEGAPQPNVRYLLTVNPSYVILALSLGNEGISNGKTRSEKDAIFKQFESGMRGFVDRSRQHGIVPIVTLCYTRNDFTEVEYEYVRHMNILLSSWDVPTVNFLGAIDDGSGKWARGFWLDALHPNAAGHVEFTRAFVPTLFEALERGKPMPRRLVSESFVRLTPGDLRITFLPQDPIHPFAVGVTARVQRDGIVATIDGTRLNMSLEAKKVDRGGNRPPLEFESATLSPAGPFTARIGVDAGMWTYTSGDGRVLRSGVRATGSWQQILVSHYTARGETLLFVDGKLTGTIVERLEPTRFALGGTTPADLKDLVLYRSALNADEASALHAGALLQASLEIYSPLHNVRFEAGAEVENLAQSLTSAKVSVGAEAPRPVSAR